MTHVNQPTSGVSAVRSDWRGSHLRWVGSAARRVNRSDAVATRGVWAAPGSASGRAGRGPSGDGDDDLARGVAGLDGGQSLAGAVERVGGRDMRVDQALREEPGDLGQRAGPVHPLAPA